MASIEINRLSKSFGPVRAVSDLSFEVEAGGSPDFSGPTEPARARRSACFSGSSAPTPAPRSSTAASTATLEHPSAHVGAVLEDASFHPGRTGRNHLRILAAAGGHPPSRVDEVLEAVGMTDAKNRRVKGYSMGMRQRLAIAAALLGDPDVLILDEPANGLDPPGIRWMRDMLRHEAGRGRTVLISSHLLSEVAQTVDDVVVISHGVLRASGPLDEVVGGAGGGVTRVRAPDAEALGRALSSAGIEHARDDTGALLASGASAEAIGAAANEHRVALSELVAVSRSLEEVFLELTGSEEEA